MNSRITLPALPGSKAVSISAFVFLSGLFMGIFMAITMEPSEKEAIAAHLVTFLSGDATDNSFLECAQAAFRKNALLWLIIFTGGFTVLGAPLSMLPLLYKGAALGLSCTMIIDSMASDGLKLIVISVLPQNMLLVPLFILAAAFALSYAYGVLSSKKSGIEKSNLPQRAGPYIVINIVLLVLFVLCAAIEAVFVRASLWP